MQQAHFRNEKAQLLGHKGINKFSHVYGSEKSDSSEFRVPQVAHVVEALEINHVCASLQALPSNAFHQSYHLQEVVRL